MARRLPYVAAAALLLASFCHAAAGKKESVTTLTAANFDAAIRGAGKPWLVEFYAPWCGHCKRLMPRFEEASQQVGSGPNALIRFGKCDADAESSMKSRFSIDGFPQLMYFDGDPSVAREYSGPRTTAALVAFAHRMGRPPVLSLEGAGEAFDLHEWARKEGTDGIAFLYVSGRGDASKLHPAFQAVAKSMRGLLTFAEVSHAHATATQGMASRILQPHSSGSCPAVSVPGAPFVARIEAGVDHIEYLSAADLAEPLSSANGYAAAVNTAQASKAGTRSDPLFGLKQGTPEAALGAWVLHWKYPLVTALGPDNFPFVANNEEGRYVAVGVVDEADATHPDGNESRPNKAFLRALRRLADPSSCALRGDVRDKFAFGWIDSTKFAGFTEQFGMKEGEAPRLLVLDAPRKAFWYDPTVDEEDEMDTWLNDIAAGRAPMQRQGIMAMPQRLVNAIGLYGAAAVGVVITSILAWLVFKLVIAEALGWNAAAREKAAEQHATARAAARKQAGEAKAARAAAVAEEDDELAALLAKVRPGQGGAAATGRPAAAVRAASPAAAPPRQTTAAAAPQPEHEQAVAVEHWQSEEPVQEEEEEEQKGPVFSSFAEVVKAGAGAGSRRGSRAGLEEGEGAGAGAHAVAAAPAPAGQSTGSAGAAEEAGSSGDAAPAVQRSSPAKPRRRRAE